MTNRVATRIIPFEKLRGTAALGCAKLANLCTMTCSLVSATLREIFDESAYDRFLARTHSERSVISYRAFLREREDAFASKPRCC